jgi:hypothetical protein
MTWSLVSVATLIFVYKCFWEQFLCWYLKVEMFVAAFVCAGPTQVAFFPLIRLINYVVLPAYVIMLKSK